MTYVILPSYLLKLFLFWGLSDKCFVLVIDVAWIAIAAFWGSFTLRNKGKEHFSGELFPFFSCTAATENSTEVWHAESSPREMD